MLISRYNRNIVLVLDRGWGKGGWWEWVGIVEAYSITLI